MTTTPFACLSCSLSFLRSCRSTGVSCAWSQTAKRSFSLPNALFLRTHMCTQCVYLFAAFHYHLYYTFFTGALFADIPTMFSPCKLQHTLISLSKHALASLFRFLRCAYNGLLIFAYRNRDLNMGASQLHFKPFFLNSFPSFFCVQTHSTHFRLNLHSLRCFPLSLVFHFFFPTTHTHTCHVDCSFLSTNSRCLLRFPNHFRRRIASFLFLSLAVLCRKCS